MTLDRSRCNDRCYGEPCIHTTGFQKPEREVSTMSKEKINKCEGSGTYQMVDWPADPSITPFGGKPYPGASVCIHCSYGVMLVRGSIHKAVSKAGFEGTAGKLRVHYIKGDPRSHNYPEKMAYTKGELR